MLANKRITYREIWSITLPIILGNLAQTMIAIIDTIFVSHLGEVELGASMMASIYYYVWTTLPWGFAIGVQILIARRVGEGKLSKIGLIFKNALLSMVVLGCLLFVLIYSFTPQILARTISSPKVLAAALEFMNYRVLGIVFVSLNYFARYFFIGISQTKIISVTTLAMGVVNVILDYGLIFGRLGLPAMGIGGAALASTIAEAVATMVFIIYLLKFFSYKKYSLFGSHKFEGAVILSLVKLSVPTMIQKLFSIGVWYLFFVMVEHLGEREIAISGILRNFMMLAGVGIFAFGASANAIVSRVIGSGHPKAVFPILRMTIISSFLFVIPAIVMCVCSPEVLLSIYTNDMSLIAESKAALMVLCLGLMSYVPGITCFEAVSGTGNTTHALLIELVVLIAYFLSAYFIINVLNAGVAAAWLCETVYGTTIFIGSYLYLRYFNWQKIKL